MKTRKFIFNKLVRDNIADEIFNNGANPVKRMLNSEDFIFELKRKLIEESSELYNTNDKEGLINEIADIQEVINFLIDELGATKAELEERQIKKNNKNGSFKRKIFIDYVECDDSFKWIEYYLSHPDKYPEM